MTAYIIRRLLLMIPTLFVIILLNFIIIQGAPGGPVERMIAELQGQDTSTSGQISSGGDLAPSSSSTTSSNSSSSYRGSQGMPPELIEKIEKLYGFDKPAWQRFLLMMKQYLTFDFGESHYHGKPVLTLIKDSLPVSISLGLWSTLIIYLVSIPLGIRKAVRNGSFFDHATSAVVVIGYAVPAFLFAILLVVFFASGTYFDWFPLRGLVSENHDQLSLAGKIIDYFKHITLPTIALVIGGFSTLTLLTKNSFLDEISKQYVVTARSKGLSERQVLYRHVFRNAMLIVVAGFPAAFVGIFFTGALLIEYIFSLNGLGLLGFEAVIQRDYPVIFGTLYIFTLLGLVMKLISDLTYMWIDPRINFEGSS